MVWFITSRNLGKDLLEGIQSHICKAKYWEGKLWNSVSSILFGMYATPALLNKSGMVLIKGTVWQDQGAGNAQVFSLD